MKRLVGCLLACLLLLCCILPAAAASELFFVSVSDTLPLSLPVVQTPYYADGVLYAPHTAFAATGLNIFPSYNAEDQVLTLFDRSRRLVFDLRAKTVTDGSGRSYPEVAEKAEQRGGVVYIPAVFCAGFFDKQIALLTSKSGYTVLRFTVGGEVYDNALFLVRAENLMQYTLQQYRARLAAPAHTEQSSAEPVPATPPASVTPQRPAPEPPADVTAFLAVVNAATMASAVDTLKRYGATAVFYLTADEIRAEPDTVRAIAAAGYPIGVTAEPSEENAEQALADANDALRELLWCKTFLALLTQTQAQSVQGYAVQLRTAARTATYTAARTDGSYLLLCDGNLANALAVLTAAKVHIRPLRETTVLK